jgi:hypothetical protein
VGWSAELLLTATASYAVLRCMLPAAKLVQLHEVPEKKTQQRL